MECAGIDSDEVPPDIASDECKGTGSALTPLDFQGSQPKIHSYVPQTHVECLVWSTGLGPRVQ